MAPIFNLWVQKVYNENRTSLKRSRYDVMFNELSELHGEHSESSARKRAMAGLVQDVTDRPGAGKGSSSTAPLPWLVNSWKIGDISIVQRWRWKIFPHLQIGKNDDRPQLDM